MHRLLPLPLLLLASQVLAFEEFWPVPPVSTTEARVLAVTSNVERELAQIDTLVEAGAWGEAVDALLRLSDESADEMLAITDNYYLPVQTATGMRIARWPAAGLAVYRQRADAAARSLYERGIRQRDSQALAAVVDEYFASSAGDDALLALADMALEAGRTNEARGYLLQLSRATLAPNGLPWGVALGELDLEDNKVRDAVLAQVTSAKVPTDSSLVYPDTDIPVAEIMARLAMVSIRERAFDRAARELAVLQLADPTAEATIGGRQANLAEALTATLQAAREWPAAAPLSDWPTFGGNAARSGVAQSFGDLSQVEWRRPLVEAPTRAAQSQVLINLNERFARPVAMAPKQLFVYPLFAGSAVTIEQQGEWLALDPQTGKLLYGETDEPLAGEQADQPIARVENRNNPVQRPLGQAQLQLRVQAGGRGGVIIQNGPAQQRIIIRGRAVNGPVVLGNAIRGFQSTYLQPVPPAAISGSLLYHVTSEDSRTGAPQYRLEATDLSAEGKLRLQIEAGEGREFSGPPVVTEEHIYLPLRDASAGGRIAMACYARTTGRPLWHSEVASITADGADQSDVLVAGEGMLYLSTDAGVIVAVRASDGRVMWARTYKRWNSIKPNDLSQVTSRQHGTAMFAPGALVCMPSDSPSLFALDPVSGRTLWVNDQAWSVDQLLGVAAGRLIASGRELWMIDPATGQTEFQWPDSPAAGVTGSGRGCLAGDEVFWPTERSIHVFSAATGQQTRNPIALDNLGGVGGANLIPCGDGLLVATKKELILLGDKPPVAPKTPPAEPKLSQSLPPTDIYD